MRKIICVKKSIDTCSVIGIKTNRNVSYCSYGLWMCYREKCILDLGSGARTGPLRSLFWDSALLWWLCLRHRPRAVLYALAHEKSWQYSHAIYRSCILGIEERRLSFLLQPRPLPREGVGEPHRRNAFGLSRVCTIWTSRNHEGLLSGGAIWEKIQQQHTPTQTQEGKRKDRNSGLINKIRRLWREGMNNETCWLRTPQLVTSELM